MFGMDLADCHRKAEEQLKTDLAALAGSDTVISALRPQSARHSSARAVTQSPVIITIRSKNFDVLGPFFKVCQNSMDKHATIAALVR